MSANTNIVVSNVRFPKDEWLQLKTAAYSHNMSVNEYMKFLFRFQTAKDITGSIKVKSKKIGYEAFDEFIESVKNNSGKGMGASEEDKIIYDIE